MASDGQRSTFQMIQSHIKELKKDLTSIEERQESLKKQKFFVEEEIYQSLDSLVDAVKECHANASKHLEKAYQEKWKKLEDVKKRVMEKKKKAENDLVVDHKRVEIPDVGKFSYTVKVKEAMQSIKEIIPKVNDEPTTLIIKLEKPDASTSAEKRKIEPSTSAVASEIQNDDVSPFLKKPKVEKKSNRTIQTLRDYVKCSKCHKPRGVYSDRGLAKDDRYFWDVVKNSLRYQCGGRLFQPLDEILNAEPVDCSTLVHWHLLGSKARERKFPLFCYNCGHELEEASKATIGESEDMESHPVCRSCSAAGIAPRTRKKPQRTASTKTSAIDVDDD